MKIARDPSSRLWTLTSGTRVLYTGYRSPWDNPRLMRAAAEQEQTVVPTRPRTARRCATRKVPALS